MLPNVPLFLLYSKSWSMCEVFVAMCKYKGLWFESSDNGLILNAFTMDASHSFTNT